MIEEKHMVAALVRRAWDREVAEMLPEAVDELLCQHGWLRQANPLQDPTHLAITEQGLDWLRRVLA